jgi:hypothetical protein
MLVLAKVHFFPQFLMGPLRHISLGWRQVSLVGFWVFSHKLLISKHLLL